MVTKKMVRFLGIITLVGILDLNGASVGERRLSSGKRRRKSHRTSSEIDGIIARAKSEASKMAVDIHGKGAPSPILRATTAGFQHDIIAGILKCDRMRLDSEDGGSASNSDNSPSDGQQ